MVENLVTKTGYNPAYKADAVKCEIEIMNNKFTILRWQTEVQVSATALYANRYHAL